MLEIFALSSLVSNIRKTLIDKNRKPGWFVALAIILWFHFEITGFIISYALGLEFPANIFPVAIMVAISVGISLLAAKLAKPGTYLTPNKRIVKEFTDFYEPLNTPCDITVTRDKAFGGGGVKYEVYLNDLSMGTVGNGFTIYSKTNQRQNVIQVKAPDGSEFPPFVFEVPDGGNADIHFASGKFLPERSTGILHWGDSVKVNPELAVARYPSNPVLSDISAEPATSGPFADPVSTPDATEYVPVAKQIPVTPVYSGARFCENCGNQIEAGSKFCDRCGSPIL